jgi:hypothetical protein
MAARVTTDDEAAAKAARTYETSAEAHGDATRSGDHRRANRAYRQLAKAHATLMSQGAAGEAVLRALLSSANPSVRVWAATHSLRFATGEAECALEALAEEPGAVGFDARVILAQWRAGTLVPS